jgi:hypothetical protein
VALSILDYAFPAGHALLQGWSTLDLGWDALIVPALYVAVIGLASNIAAIPSVKAHRSGYLILGGYVLSILAFLPMAWVKHFDHYHYWPMAMRAIFVVGLGLAAGSGCLRTLSPPGVQAPPRTLT